MVITVEGGGWSWMPPRLDFLCHFKREIHRMKIGLIALLVTSVGLAASQGAHAQIVGSDASSLALLEELTNADAPSGFEGPVRDILRTRWQGLLQNLHTDGVGNLLGELPGGSGQPRVLLMAHMDEVGFLVRFIDDNGFVYFHSVGGSYNQSVLTQRMTILTPKGPIVGYTGFKSGHAFQGNERNEMVQLRDMFLDVGASSRREAIELGIRPGLPIAYRTRFEPLNGTGRFLAKAWDARVGLATITEVVQNLQSQPHPNTVQVAATVQEEIGMRGAAVVYETFQPDIVINIEIGIASDFPLKASPKEAQGTLGDGPSVFVFDGSVIPNHNFVDWIIAQAEANDIPYQFESVSGYGEDASRLQLAGKGVPVVNLGITTRYGHGQSGVIDIADYRNAVELVTTLVRGLDQETVTNMTRF